MYINESEASKAIQCVVIEHKLHLDDFKIYPIKRKSNGTKKVSVFFILKVKSLSENEALFNKFMKVSLNEESMQIIESELSEENRVIKEMFLIKCEINIFGV